MKKKSAFRNIIACIALCLAMLLSFCLTACDGEATDVNESESEQTDKKPADSADEAPADDSDKIEVVRALEDIGAGIKVTTGKVEVVKVDKDSLPDGTILGKDDVIGKFATVDIIAGDYFTPVKLANVRPTVDGEDDSENESDGVINFADAGYVIVSDYVKADTGKDVADDIQRLIDENPNKTLYFPDGEYLISKPITTSADPAKSVSLELSNYAYFRNTENWSGGEEAMFRLGATDMAEGISNEGNYYSFTGGIIDGTLAANAISVENAGTVSIRYVSIKNAVVGIHVKGDEEGNGPCVDIHTVNVVGSLTVDSIGVLVESNGNTITNMRIASNQIAVKLSGSDNFLRNLHPLYIFANGFSEEYMNSYAFYDEGTRNFYDNCYNDQFAVGFFMSKDTASVYDCCFNYWYSPNYYVHISYLAEGQFNSTIRSSGSDTSHADKGTRCEFLIVGEEGGNGVIQTVYFNPDQVQDDAYLDYIIGEPIR